MEKIITLQKEFEDLVFELEKLKSVNDITSTNSNNAKSTIDEMKSLVKAIETFKITIAQDYEAKKNDLKSANTSFNDAIKSLNDIKDKTNEANKKLREDFANKTDETSKLFKSNLEKEIEQFKAEIESSKNSVQKEVNDFTEKTKKHLDEKIVKIQETLSDFKIAQISNLKSLEDSNNKNLSTLKEGATEFHSSFHKRINELGNQNVGYIASLSEEIKLLQKDNQEILKNNDFISEKVTQLLERNEFQSKKVNGLNKTILFFLVIIILMLSVIVFKNILPYIK